MNTLYDIFQNAQNGSAQNNIARQFGLNQEQTQKAIEALMPAFSSGLKRNVSDPNGFASFMDALSTGKHEKYVETPDEVFSSSAMKDGNAILGHLFGSKDVSRAVAANAAKATGIGETILKQMLPALAPMIMGGLFKQMSGQAQQASQAGAMGNNPLGQIFEQMMGGARSSGSGNPLQDILGQMMGGGKTGHNQGKSGNPLEDILGQMMGGAGNNQPRQTEKGASDSPLGEIFGEMLRGGTGRGDASAEQENSHERDQYDETRRSDPQTGGLGDLFGEMFESGKTVQRDYQKSVDNIFDQYLDGMKRR